MRLNKIFITNFKSTVREVFPSKQFERAHLLVASFPPADRFLDVETLCEDISDLFTKLIICKVASSLWKKVIYSFVSDDLFDIVNILIKEKVIDNFGKYLNRKFEQENILERYERFFVLIAGAIEGYITAEYISNTNNEVTCDVFAYYNVSGLALWVELPQKLQIIESFALLDDWIREDLYLDITQFPKEIEYSSDTLEIAKFVAENIAPSEHIIVYPKERKKIHVARVIHEKPPDTEEDIFEFKISPFIMYGCSSSKIL